MPTGLTRRQFLQSTLAAGTLLPAVSAGIIAAEDADQGEVRFGFSLYGMRSLKTADALAACADIGYDSVELVATEGWPCDPDQLAPADQKELRTLLQDHTLEVDSLMENLHAAVEPPRHRENLDRLKAAAELGHEISPDRPPVIETILGGSPAQWDALREKMADRLRDWAEVGKAATTIITVKPHVSGALHTPQGAKWLVEAVGSPWLKLAYDYSHFQLRGFDLEESLKAMIGDTRFVHVKDAQGKPGDFRFLLPGEGAIDYARYFQLLKSSGYRGAVVVEVSGQIHGKPDYDPLAAAKRSYANLAPLFEKSGLRVPRH